MRLFRTDTFEIEDTDVDDRGIYTFQGILIREGPMPYVRKEHELVKQDGSIRAKLIDSSEEGKVQWEMLRREDLQKEQVKKSLMYCPVTDGHPGQFINPNNIGEQISGVIDRIETTEVAEEPGDKRFAIRGNLVIHDPDLGQAIQDGKKQISTGRSVDLKPAPEDAEFRGKSYDALQVNMKINHTAIVDKGRCGPTCSISVGDELPGEAHEFTEDVIRKTNGEYCIFSESGEKLECFETEEAAEERLQQIEFFKQEDQQGFTEYIRSKIKEKADNSEEEDELINEVAQKSGRTHSEVTSQIAGSIQPTQPVIKALADVLGITKQEINTFIARPTDGEASNKVDKTDSSKDNSNNSGDNMNPTATDGENFGEWVSKKIEERAIQGTESKSEVIGRVAENSGRSDSNIRSIMSGEIECPPLETLEAFAKVLNLQTTTIVNHAREDGCSYSLNNSDGGINTMEVTIDGKTYTFDCGEGCNDADELKETIIELRDDRKELEDELEEVKEENKRLEGRLDQMEEQPAEEPAESPQESPEERSEESSSENEEMKINLIMAIREENPEYDYSGKELEQIMLDALRILGDVDVESMTEDKRNDSAYLEARLDALIEQRTEGKVVSKDTETPQKDPEEDVKSLDEQIEQNRAKWKPSN